MSEQVKPPCFGISQDPADPLCAGGINYTANSQGGYLQERCPFFNECGETLRLKKVPPTTIPLSSLIRPPETPASSSPPPPLFNLPQPTNGPTFFTPAPAAAAPRPMPPMPPPPPVQPHAPTPQQVPTPHPYFPVNYSIPDYLREPEPIYHDEPVWVPFVRELARSVLKSVGHSTGAFMDRTPFRRRLPDDSKK